MAIRRKEVRCEGCDVGGHAGIKLRDDGRFLCDACAAAKTLSGLSDGAGPSVETVRDAVLGALTGLDAARVVEASKRAESLAAKAEEVVEQTKKIAGDAEVAITSARGTVADAVERIEAEARRLAEIKPAATVIVEFKRDDVVTAIGGHQHKQLPRLAELVANKIDCYLCGPAGGGKNTAAEQVARGFGLKYYSLQLSQLSLRSELLGFVSPLDKSRVETPFTLAYEHGGVFLADELDNWNASIVTAANSALANGEYSFAWGTIKRHPDFVWVGAGNTAGLGATMHYQERRSLSGATRSRMVTLSWGIDEDLERQIAGDAGWVQLVQAARRACESNGERILVCPRTSIQGAKLLKMGWSRREVVNAVLLRGVELPGYLQGLVEGYCNA